VKRWLGTLLRRHVYGRKRFEPAFRFLHHYAIAGLFTVGDSFGGTGEVAVLGRLAPMLPADPVILDVGANVGGYARVVLDRFPTVSLHCSSLSKVRSLCSRRRLGMTHGSSCIRSA
jgi:hypothetical protein